MSWSIQKKGTPAEVKAAVKADSGASYMPDGLTLLIDELLDAQQAPVSLATNGHVWKGIGEVHLTIAPAPAEAKPAAG